MGHWEQQQQQARLELELEPLRERGQAAQRVPR
jgi:hypothetical protein